MKHLCPYNKELLTSTRIYLKNYFIFKCVILFIYFINLTVSVDFNSIKLPFIRAKILEKMFAWLMNLTN